MAPMADPLPSGGTAALAAAFAATPAAITVVDAAGRFVAANPAFCEMAGRPAGDLLGARAIDALAVDDQAAARRQGGLLAEGAATADLDARLVRPSGEERSVTASVCRVAGDGEPVLYVCTVVDRTEERRLASEGAAAQAELNDTRERHRLSFEHAPIGQALVALDGTWLAVNPALARLLGRDAAALRSMTFQEITHPDDLGADLDLLARLVEGQIASYDIGKRYLRPDGSVVWADLHVAVVRNEEGTPLYFVSQIEDVTERRRRERELQQLSTEVQFANQALQGVIEQAQAGEARYRALVDHLPDTAVYLYDRDHRITMAAGAGPTERGFEEAGVVGKRPEDLLPAVDAAFLHGALDDAFAGRPVSAERPLGAEQRPNLVDVVALEPPRPGDPHEALVVARDISDRKAKERALAAAEARYSALIEHSSDVTTITDSDGRILYASPAYAAVTGRCPTDAVGTSVRDLVHPEDRQLVESTLGRLARTPGGVTSYSCRLRHADGSDRHVEVVATNRLDDPAVGGIVANARDLTERVEAAERFARQAMHDPLTDLPNRALFLDRLEVALARSRREGRGCAVLYLDVDHFKRINDSLGHGTGDQVLVAVAERLQSALRPGDTVARLGGDEFVVLAEHVAGADVARSIAERLRTAVVAPIELDDQVLTVGCSVGVAVSDRHRPEALVQEADVALYRAKERGRNRCEVYDQAMQRSARRRQETEQLIRSALKGGNLVVAHQPIVELATGRVVATEALARIRTGSGRLLAAGEFIHVAETAGLIEALGAVVLRQACAEHADWVERGLAPPTLSVNVSPRQLRSGRLLDDVTAALADHHLAAERLCLELTEPALVDAERATHRTVDRLKELGVRLALDDFGTGWSSLAYLRRFPIDLVKVDRSVVAGLGRDADDTEVVRAIVGVGHTLGLATVAEGVERPSQEQVLKELGCEQAQGYRYGRPVEAAAVTLEPSQAVS